MEVTVWNITRTLDQTRIESTGVQIPMMRELFMRLFSIVNIFIPTWLI